MANLLIGNRWVIDTANNNAVATGYLKLAGMEWINPANAADDLEIHDGSGNNLIWATIAGSNNGGSLSPGFIPGWIEGITVTKIDSGKLILYLE